jgi:serine/threonine protein kinase
MSAERGPRSGVALVVGAGKYLHADEVQPLPFATLDAQAMARLLSDPKVCAFPADQVELLTDEKARRETIVKGLSIWLPERARGVDIAVIYFAGHGMVQRIGHREEAYLLPYDFAPDNFGAYGVTMTEIATWIDAVEAKAVVVILDCCHAGHVLNREGTTVRSALREATIKPALFQGMSGKGRFLIASCDEGQVSIESEKLKHGLFTYHLLRGLKGRADRDGDGAVGVGELFRYVSTAVARDAKAQFGMEQQPWTNATYAGEVILSWAASKDRNDAEAERIEKIEALWRERGPSGAIAEIERNLRTQDETWLLSVLRFLRTKREPHAIPLLFYCLAQDNEPIRERAKKLVEKFGWETVEATVKMFAQQATDQSPDRVIYVLKGLDAIESKREVITLLEELGSILKGDLRARTVRLLERKQLSQGMETVAEVFREKQSPYRIEKVLGQGVFTAAYLGTHKLTDLPVVVRVLRSRFVDDYEVRIKFLEVSKRSFAYVHPNLVHTRDAQAIADRQIYYTVRDFIQGVTLQNVLDEGRKFEPLQILEILRQTLTALTPLHERGHFHGGIKPSNIFFSDADRVRVVVGDPSMSLGQLNLERLCYDYRYAAPEMIRNGHLTPLLDLYSVGCLGYELLCGTPPFVADNAFDLGVKHLNEPYTPPSKRQKFFGPPGDFLFKRLLAKSVSDRFSDIEQVIQALASLRDQLRAPSETKSRPVTLIRQSSLAAFNQLHSIVKLEAQLRPDPQNEGAAPTPSKGPFSTISPMQTVERDDPMMSSPPDSRLPARQSDDAAGDDTSGTSAAARPSIFAERLLFEKYRLIRKVGQGGMGEVWLVENFLLDRQSALKLIKPEITSNDEVWRRFQREARIMASLVHPNAVTIYDFGRTQSIAYIDMEFIRGRTLHEHLRESSGRTLSLESIAQIVDQLCSVLHEAHHHVDPRTGTVTPIIHRDIKPSNLMLDDHKPSGQNLKVLDFGIAKILELEKRADIQATGAGTFIGTPAYMSPEQIRHQELDARSDLYSVGVLLYELLTGTLPFVGRTADVMMSHLTKAPESMHNANPSVEVPVKVERVVMNCLEKDPAKRPQSATQLAEMFRAAVDEAARHPGSRFAIFEWFNRLLGRLPKWGSSRSHEPVQPPEHLQTRSEIHGTVLPSGRDRSSDSVGPDSRT